MYHTSFRDKCDLTIRILIVVSLPILLPNVSAVIISEHWGKIIGRYVSLCGDDFICNKDQIATKGPSEKRKTNIKCPNCSCDSLCRLNGSCCPDFSSNTCVQTSFDPAKSENSEWLFMTNDCLYDTEESLVQKCQQANTDENLLKRIPVTSTQTNMTYSNVHCAECNRETAFVSWAIESDCKVDKSSFTNVANLWEIMKKKHCKIRYIPPTQQNFPLPQKCIRDNNLIDRCNISGLVSTLDKSLELACKSTLQPIRLFKNVFCLLCNIQDNAFDPPISTCNVTGKVINLDEQVEYKCLNQSVDLMKYPYKNEFCEECNLVKTDDGHYQYSDVNLTISVYNRFQDVSKNRNIPKHVYVSEFTLHSLNFSLEPNLSNYNDNITSSLNNTKRHFEKTQDFRQDFSWFVKDNWCGRIGSRYLVVNSISMKTCSCTEQCYDTNTCCKDPDDVLYTMRHIQMWGCVRMSAPRSISNDEPTYFVISKCPADYQNDVIRGQCESDTGENFLSFIPVTDMRESITYKNYYCFLCVSPPQKFDPNDQPVPWRVSLQCPIPFNFKNEANLQSIFKQGLTIQCTFHFAPNIPPSAPVPCQDQVVSSLYCSLCDSSYRKTSNSINVGKEYRSVFSVYDNIDVTIHTNINKFEACSKNQILDRRQGKCRTLACCAGKVLSDGKCKSIISSNLTKIYNIAFRARIIAGDWKRHIDENLLVQKIIRFVTEDLYYDTNVDVSVMKYYIRANWSCSEIMEMAKLKQVLFRIFMKVSIQGEKSAVFLNTDLIEQILFNLTSKTRFLGNISIEGHEDVRAWFLPLSKKPIQPIPFCDIRAQSLSPRLSSFDINELGININKLLFCPQVSLSPDEFSTSSDGLQVLVRSINRTFYYNEFSRGVNGTVRICVDEYMGNNVSPSSLKDRIPERPFSLALSVISAIATCVSLLSLLVTFVVYCILKKLRTIPGQNLMCFSGSLFFAQLFTLLKDFFNIYNMACTAVGILTYYFWLAVFTCANVCCFHMFRVFVCHTRFQDKYLCSRSLVCYIIYAFTLPLIFSIVTIGCHVTLSPAHGSGFGGYTCFIEDRQTQLFSFILPISAICLVNFVLFTVTFCKIYSAPTMENTNSHYSRNDLTIYFKLFLLTGTAWMFQIIDGLFAVSPFSYLVTILIASQGLYIMISFVFNRRVKCMLNEIGFYEKIHFFTIPKISSSGSTQLTQKITDLTDRPS